MAARISMAGPGSAGLPTVTHPNHSEILSSELTALNSTSALYRQAFSRHRRDGSEISRQTTTYLVTDGPMGRRISVLAIRQRASRLAAAAAAVVAGR